MNKNIEICQKIILKQFDGIQYLLSTTIYLKTVKTPHIISLAHTKRPNHDPTTTFKRSLCLITVAAMEAIFMTLRAGDTGNQSYVHSGYYIVLTICLVAIVYFIFRSLRAVYNRRRELDRQLKRKEQELLFAERKEYFTGIINEFRAPLTVITGICDTLSHLSSTNTELKPYVDKLRSNADHLSNLAQEILEARDIDNDNIELNIQPMTIESIFKKWVYGYEEIARQNNINLSTIIEQPNLRLNTDETCMGKIITALMSNAIKYTPAGGDIRVTAGLNAMEELRLEVYNTGKGISKKERNRLFDKRPVIADGSNDTFQDISTLRGLGMSICHQMAVLLGAQIKVESAEGEYARFIVVFPKMNVQPAGDDETPNVTADTPRELVDKPEILVVDDNPDILWLVSSILSKEHVVTAANNVTEARQAIEQQIPALIITDITMPGESGLEFIRFIRENRYTRNLPIIVLSAKSSEKDKIDGYKAGADAYFTKPFNTEILSALVARMLQRKSSDIHYYRSPESAATLDNGKEISNESKMFIDNMRKYIINNLDDENKLSPAALAKAMSVDIRTLYRRFKKDTPYTPSEFVKSIRYAYAANLILTTTLTIQEIIYQIGMNNKTVFYSDFKKIYGMTPKEYRKVKH